MQNLLIFAAAVALGVFVTFKRFQNRYSPGAAERAPKQKVNPE